MATIKQLVARKAKLEADLAKVLEELAARDGEVDPVTATKPAVEATAMKRAAV
jgi:hypothetical protein